ncbi:MAG: Phage protein [Parcubacteria bacterium C7867-006]|nr:MAG: Phage protein [Parcubacteria bacterium C7867-006]
MTNLNPDEEKIIERMIKDRTFRVAMVRKSHYWFFHYYFGRDYVKYQTAEYQREIFQLTEDSNIQNLVITAFRGSAKSTIITLSYIIWSIVGEQQKKFPLILGKTQLKAQNHLMNIKKELEQNDELRRDLGPFKEESNQWGAQSLILFQYGARISIGSVEQSIRGIRHNQHRPDVIVCDDLEDSESVKTQESRDKLFEWLTGDVLPAGDKDTRMIFIGTPLHQDSLLMRLKGIFKGSDSKSIFRQYPIVDENNLPLWPGKFPYEEDIEMEKAKCFNLLAWQREYLLQTVEREDQVIHREWIQYYDVLPPDNFHTYRAVGIDLAISLKDSADYTAMVPALVQGRGQNLRIYILPNVVNRRLTSLETIEQAKLMSSVLGRPRLFVETNGYQASIIEHLKKENCNVVGVRSVGDKYDRLSAVSFLIESGQVLFPKTGAEQLINQLTGFGSERHDDLADAFSMLLSKVIENNHRSVSFGVFPPRDDSDLNHLSSREKLNIIEKRNVIRNGPRWDAI